MAVNDARWVGWADTTIRENTRRVAKVEERVDVLHDAFVAHRARTSLIVGIVAFLGSGAGGTLLLLVTGSLH